MGQAVVSILVTTSDGCAELVSSCNVLWCNSQDGRALALASTLNNIKILQSPPHSPSPPNWMVILLTHSRTHYLDHLLHQSLVSPCLGTLQPTHVLSNPRDEGKLGSFAHGVAGGEAHEGKQPDIICGQNKENMALSKDSLTPSPWERP